MEVIKEFQTVESNEIRVHLPDQFLHKEIEITVRAVENLEKSKKKKSDVQFNALRLNTRGFKFNRDEAHDR
jgi:hypothetical protein